MKRIPGLPIRLALSIVSLFLPASQAWAGDTAAAPAGQPAHLEMKQVLADYDAGHYDRAMALCKRILIADPTSLTAHYVMGNICVKCNQIKDARAQYEYCLKVQAGKASPEASYAKKALDQLDLQELKDAPSLRQPAGSSGRGQASAGTSKDADEYIREQTETLMKENKEKVAVKKRTLEDKIKQIHEDMQQQLYNLPRVGMRRMAQMESKNDAQEQVKQEAQDKVDQLRKEFDREAEEINQSYQNRINALTEHFRNVESQSTGRSGSR